MGLLDDFGGLLASPLTAGASALGMETSRIPILGSLFESDEEKQARQSFKEMAEKYRAMRPDVAQSYQNALRQTLGALGPSNAFVQGMAGGDPRFALDLNALGANPATPGMVAGVTPPPASNEDPIARAMREQGRG